LALLSGVGVLICATVLLRGGVLAAAASDETSEKAEKSEKTEKKAGKPEDQKKGLPPLVVDKNAPLLLEEPPEKDPWEVPSRPAADNTACYVCHTNYDEETFAVVHAKANIGCVKCHGASYPHRNDEDNITPPDVMFPPGKIESNCRECHRKHNVPPREVVLRWRQRCPEKTKPEEILCTDCHGNHRLKSRTVRWDKTTGKLLRSEPKKTGREAGAEGGKKPAKNAAKNH